MWLENAICHWIFEILKIISWRIYSWIIITKVKKCQTYKIDNRKKVQISASSFTSYQCNAQKKVNDTQQNFALYLAICMSPLLHCPSLLHDIIIIRKVLVWERHVTTKGIEHLVSCARDIIFTSELVGVIPIFWVPVREEPLIVLE